MKGRKWASPETSLEPAATLPVLREMVLLHAIDYIFASFLHIETNFAIIKGQKELYLRKKSSAIMLTRKSRPSNTDRTQ